MTSFAFILGVVPLLIATGAGAELRQSLGTAFFDQRYTIGFWHWETANFPEQWHDRFAYLDEIWVDSGYVQKTLAAVAPIPVVNVRLPLHAPQPAGLTRAELGLPDDRFLFLFVFDMASGMERKNPLGLIRAFRLAFRPDEPVHLAIKVSRGEKHPAEFAALRRAADRAGVTLLDRLLPRGEVLALLADCDAYVSLHRSEGLGLPLIEAMYLGKPVVATGYGGVTDFLDDETGFVVRHRLVALEKSQGPYPVGAVWAEPDVEHAAALMRALANAPESAAARIAAARSRRMRRLPSESPCAGASKVSTEKPAATSGSTKAPSCAPRPSQPCTSSTVGPTPQRQHTTGVVAPAQRGERRWTSTVNRLPDARMVRSRSGRG